MDDVPFTVDHDVPIMTILDLLQKLSAEFYKD